MISTTVTEVQAGAAGRSTEVSSVTQAEVDFGLRDTAANLAARLKPVAQALLDWLSEVVDHLTNLEVRTYTASDLGQVSYDSKANTFSDGAVLRALTRISLNGDILNLAPERPRLSGAADNADQVAVEIDAQLWQIHREMVDLAQSNKVALVRALAEIVAGLSQPV